MTNGSDFDNAFNVLLLADMTHLLRVQTRDMAPALGAQTSIPPPDPLSKPDQHYYAPPFILYQFVFYYHRHDYVLRLKPKTSSCTHVVAGGKHTVGDE